MTPQKHKCKFSKKIGKYGVLTESEAISLFAKKDSLTTQVEKDLVTDLAEKIDPNISTKKQLQTKFSKSLSLLARYAEQKDKENLKQVGFPTRTLGFILLLLEMVFSPPAVSSLEAVSKRPSNRR